MTQNTNNALSHLIENGERIGIIGSPSSTTELTLDIMATAVGKKLVGELAIFKYQQEGLLHYALGQIVEVRLRNVWHEDPTMRSLIRHRGPVDTVSERQDTHTAEMVVSAVFCEEKGTFRPSFMGTVPATGTFIYLVTDPVLQSVLSPYQEELFYLGRVYGSTPLLPLWFKHFDVGGAGEAYHIGIFGKTGSGKSVLAKMILLAYARHPNMGILVIDPQGEFSKDLQGQPASGSFKLPLKNILNKNLKKSVEVYSIRDLVLDRWDLFAQLLYESRFFEALSIPKGDNRQLAAEILADRLQKKIKLSELYKKESFKKAWEILGDESVQKIFYRSEGSRERFQSVYRTASPDDFYRNFWYPVTQLFREDRKDAKKVESLLRDLLNPENSCSSRPVVVIDLSGEAVFQSRQSPEKNSTQELFGGKGEQASEKAPSQSTEASEESVGGEIFWSDTVQALIIRRILDGIRVAAERAYKEDRSLNTLVIMDEAHRLAPREEPEEEHRKAIRAALIDAVRTTRKYGLGWMFISQTLASLHREIIEQLRIFFFGFGLGVGTELKALSELVGGRSKALELYQTFRDPHSSFDTSKREYSFMTIGPVSPLSFSGTPLFFNAFNSPEDFMKANKLVV